MSAPPPNGREGNGRGDEVEPNGRGEGQAAEAPKLKAGEIGYLSKLFPTLEYVPLITCAY